MWNDGLLLSGQTVGEYCHLNDQLMPDSVAMCLARRFTCCSSDVAKQWIMTALLKLSPYVSNLPLLLETIKTNSDSESREVLQVCVLAVTFSHHILCALTLNGTTGI